MKLRSIIITLSVMSALVLVAFISYKIGVLKNNNQVTINSMTPPEIHALPAEQIPFGAGVHANEEIAPDLPGSFVSFPEGSFRIRIPEWWVRADSTIFSNEPYYFKNIQGVFTHKKKGCSLIYSGAPSAPSTQSHFISQTKINDSGMSFGALRSILLSSLPQNPATTTSGFVFLRGGVHEPYLPYEFASFYITGNDSQKFYLVSNDDKPLTEECETEARGIIKTFSNEFATSTLANAQGILFLGTEIIGPSTTNQTLFLLPGQTKGVKKIFTFEKGAASFTFSSKKQLFTYAVNSDKPKIMQATLTDNGEIETVELAKTIGGLTIPDNMSIVDFFTERGTTYYLTGPETCHEYKGACTTALFEYDDQTKTIHQIAKDIRNSSIVGVSQDNTEILLASYFGDAGCWANSYTRIHLSDGYKIAAGSFNGCFDDNGNSQNVDQERGQEDLVGRFRGNPFKKSISSFLVQKNILGPQYIENGNNSAFDRSVMSFHLYPTIIRAAEDR